MTEHRRSPRVALDHAVEFLTKDLDSALRMDGVGKEISLGGMFIQTVSTVRFGEYIVVYLTLPGGKREMALPAVVRWGREDGIGVQFGQLGAHDTHAVVEFMARKTSATSSWKSVALQEVATIASVKCGPGQTRRAHRGPSRCVDAREKCAARRGLAASSRR